jgi:hypothetical protein
MSDNSRWSVRPPRTQPGESAGPSRTTGAGTDLRPRFSDLLRQRRPTEPEDGMPPRDGATLEPIEALEQQPRQDGADEPVDEDEAAGRDWEAAWPAPEPVVVPAPPDLVPTDLAAGGAARAAQAQAAQLAAPPQVMRLADTVAHFCNDRAATAGDSWQVQIELRPDLLPATNLLLSLSPHWLCLRFDIRDDGARQLVFAHRQALAEQLEDTLVRRREISITFD